MPRASGPTVARWQLSRQLRMLREEAELSASDAGEVLDCTEWKIYKIESGNVGISRPDLTLLLDKYGVTDKQRRDALFDLQKRGKQRGWWGKFGQLPASYTMILGLQSAATEIKSFELSVIPGLLQTEDYARALIMTQGYLTDEKEINKRVQVRLARQARLAEDPVRFWAIVDEAALRRPIGGKDVMRAQLEHLIQMNKRTNVSVQVLPFAEGAHPGLFGSIVLLDFPEDVRSPIAYTETFAGDAFMEKDDDLWRANMAFTHLHSVALSATKSTQFIAAIAKELA